MNVLLTPEQLNEPISILEYYGLTPKIIDALEFKMGILKICDLSEKDSKFFTKHKQFSHKSLAALKHALNNYINKIGYRTPLFEG